MLCSRRGAHGRRRANERRRVDAPAGAATRRRGVFPVAPSPICARIGRAPRAASAAAHALARAGASPDRRDGRATSARIWRPFHPGDPAVVCVHARGTGAVPLHAHEQLQLTIPLAPCRFVDGRGHVHTLGPGQTAVILPSELHGVAGDGAPWETLEMLIEPAVASGLADAGRRARPAAAGREPDEAAPHAEVHTIVAALVGSLRQSLRAEHVEARLMAAVGRLLAGVTPPAPVPDDVTRTASGVERARAYLCAHVAEAVDLNTLARAAFLSKYHLVRAFARAHGLTPHAYQMQLRLARARALIERGTGISHATYAAGFADQSHLTRRFREYFGYTPAAYARALACRGPGDGREATAASRASAAA
jgi:AraC-like DNA-binding protein